ncbi:MAG: hypothetical protein HC840_32055 [Leptolyngbyaceae cyanobacterium RM2_2_4]|nr:hypothetical protein [Leptolyngbyaceae cyanobacterium RM2_2_4]
MIKRDRFWQAQGHWHSVNFWRGATVAAMQHCGCDCSMIPFRCNCYEPFSVTWSNSLL